MTEAGEADFKWITKINRDQWYNLFKAQDADDFSRDKSFLLKRIMTNPAFPQNRWYWRVPRRWKVSSYSYSKQKIVTDNPLFFFSGFSPHCDPLPLSLQNSCPHTWREEQVWFEVVRPDVTHQIRTTSRTSGKKYATLSQWVRANLMC